MPIPDKPLSRKEEYLATIAGQGDLKPDFPMSRTEQYLDAIAAQSKGIEVVELNAMSGTLSDEDFAKVSSNNCVIMSSTQYYYKQYSASTVIRYGATPRLTAQSVIFDYVDIDKETKSYEVKYESLPL